VLQSNPGAINAYKIANLIHFYTSTISRTIGTTSRLSVALTEMSASSHRVFFDTLNVQASELLRYVAIPDADLLVPGIVKETVGQLRDILASYDGSLLDEAEKEGEVARVLSASLDPLLQMCHEGSAHLGLVEGATYMINCLHFIHVWLICLLILDGVGVVSVHGKTCKGIRSADGQSDPGLDWRDVYASFESVQTRAFCVLHRK
jgi:hypothetical protein